MLSICYTWKNVKRSHKNNKFKISTTTWNEEFELKEHGEKTANLSIRYTKSRLKLKQDIISNFNS